jgi:hypothetical protein
MGAGAAGGPAATTAEFHLVEAGSSRAWWLVIVVGEASASVTTVAEYMTPPAKPLGLLPVALPRNMIDL